MTVSPLCTCDDPAFRTRYGCTQHGEQPRERTVTCAWCQHSQTTALNAICEACWTVGTRQVGS